MVIKEEYAKSFCIKFPYSNKRVSEIMNIACRYGLYIWCQGMATKDLNIKISGHMSLMQFTTNVTNFKKFDFIKEKILDIDGVEEYICTIRIN